MLPKTIYKDERDWLKKSNIPVAANQGIPFIARFILVIYEKTRRLPTWNDRSLYIVEMARDAAI